jgi:hypothetical protein
MRRLNKDLIRILQDWGEHESKNIGLEFPPITPVGKMLHSPGRSTRRGIGPRYEPEPAAKRVNLAMGDLGPQDRRLMQVRYQEGISDRVISLYCKIKQSQVCWAMEVAHRNMAKALNMPVYR